MYNLLMCKMTEYISLYSVISCICSCQVKTLKCNGSQCLFCTQQINKYFKYLAPYKLLQAFDCPLFASSEAASILLAGWAIVYICWARAKARLLVAGDK